MADLITEITWARHGLNRLYTTQSSNQKVGLGDLLLSLANGSAGEVTSFNGRTGAVVPQAGDYTTDMIPQGATNLYFTTAGVLATTLTGYSSAPGTISPSDTILSAIGKLNGNISSLTGAYLEIDGGNEMMGNIYFSPDDLYKIGNTTANRPAAVNTLTVNAGTGSGETGFLNIGDSSMLTQLVGAAGTLTITANGYNAIVLDGQGDVSFNPAGSVVLAPFFSFGPDGSAVLGGYPSPAVRTQFRPGHMAVKRDIGIGTGAGEIGALQLGDFTKGNIIYGNADGSMNLWLNNLKMLFIDANGNWWLDQDVSGPTPAMIYTQDNYRSIGQTPTQFRPSHVWVAQSVGIGLASGQSGTLNMGVGGATLVGDTSGNIVVTLGASGTLQMGAKKITGLAAGVASTDAVNVSQLGGVTPGFPLQGPNESATTPTYSFSSSTSTGMFSSASNVLDFATNGVDRWQILNYAIQVPPITSGTGTSGNGATISGQAQSVASATAAGGSLTVQGGAANGTTSTGNGGAVSILGGTTTGGAGGGVSISGSSGSSVGAGGAGGNVNISGGAAQGNQTTNFNGGSISITGGVSVGSASGGGVTINAGGGGTGTGTAGSSGSQVVINGGTGGVGSATSGSGGNVDCFAGTGGGGVAGGNGGAAQLQGGTGGTGSASGGNGGTANVTGGSPANFAGSNGGPVSITSGNGTNTGSGGNGGTITITTGTAGGNNTTNQTGGSFTVNIGHSIGGGGGSNISMTAGAGGVGTSTTGANGGQVNITGGSGGLGSSTGGNGGSITFQAGVGANSSTPGVGGDINFQAAGTISATTYLTVSHTATVQVKSSQLQVVTAGFGISIAHGSNCKLGTSTLSAGTVTVSNTSVTSNSIIFLSVKTVGGTQGILSVGTIVASTSFVINSSSTLDTSTVAWYIIEGI